MSVTLIRFLSLLTITAAVCSAQQICITTSGTMSTIFQTASFWDGSIYNGVPFTANYYFGVNPTDLNADSDIGEYRNSQLNSVVVTVGNYTFTSNNSHLQVTNNPVIYGDGYSLQSDGPFTSSGLTFTSVALRSNLYSFSDFVFPTDAFPTATYNLASFDNDKSFAIYGTFASGSQTAQLSGAITSYAITQVPEPATWVLMIGPLSLGCVIGWRRSKRRAVVQVS